MCHPDSVKNTTPFAAEIATLNQRARGGLKAEQKRQRLPEENAEVDAQLVGTRNRKQSRGACNQVRVTVRQSWQLAWYDGFAVQPNDLRKYTEQARDV